MTSEDSHVLNCAEFDGVSQLVNWCNRVQARLDLHSSR